MASKRSFPEVARRLYREGWTTSAIAAQLKVSEAMVVSWVGAGR